MIQCGRPPPEEACGAGEGAGAECVDPAPALEAPEECVPPQPPLEPPPTELRSPPPEYRGTGGGTRLRGGVLFRVDVTVRAAATVALPSRFASPAARNFSLSPRAAFSPDAPGEALFEFTKRCSLGS